MESKTNAEDVQVSPSSLKGLPAEGLAVCCDYDGLRSSQKVGCVRPVDYNF
jgi:hypothetical protein